MLDYTDMQILEELSKNSRITYERTRRESSFDRISSRI